MPTPPISGIKPKSIDPSTESTKTKYLDADKKVDIKSYLDKLSKEEKSGLKGIEVRETPKQLGKDDFLKLLITQLSQQDPTNPMKDQDFIAQMAQFSSLEQMKNISAGITRMEAKQSYSLVGKVVSGPDMVTGETVVGIAAALFFDADGKSYVRVNGRSVEVEKITLISDPSVLNQEKEISTNNIKENQIEKKTSIQENQNLSDIGTAKQSVHETIQSLDKPVDWNYPGAKTNKGTNYEK
ncbi:MAG TPA: flagellar hook capping FlgD N-terminal domain-containing protein [Leptospiraceae bacterium]|nr:flagellar hook capping FlgD N-terminal domain-containing protein [Leptospiraceae bacterium]HMW06736.1 flagellar hook capping FlgD N-terminal domain-containing protein [Leptospiraceae bacterium]HMX33521.1 flagellar hook capping FlgD N-terminal domain-containing protein [Leptospiraceae bacterium]HMY32042.1 flagellar hook capping FlgD N-terminal domain-containing protein [Leptospiraceae bacterium]HMZ63965.1 flagellar hook capping FlgD N-terminal domain-containing protein [Leptospiraceae bacteri